MYFKASRIKRKNMNRTHEMNNNKECHTRDAHRLPSESRQQDGMYRNDENESISIPNQKKKIQLMCSQAIETTVLRDYPFFGDIN